MAFAQILRIHS